jgi:hypothetical protein
MIQALSRTGASPRFPMYVRQFKHFLKTFDESFDERQYGFAGILDALRFGQREGLFRLDRGRQGGVRVHPGAQYQQLTQSSEAAPAADVPVTGEGPHDRRLPADPEAVAFQDAPVAPEQPPTTPEPPPVEADVTPPDQTAEAAPAASSGEPASVDEAAAAPATAPRATARKRTAAGTRTATRARKAAAPAGAPKKRAARPRAKKS